MEKTSYTNGVKDSNNERLLSYTPTLSEGTWYWHVKAKGDDESWSDFSETRVFTISSEARPQPLTLTNGNILGESTMNTKQNFTITTATNKLKDIDPIPVSVLIQNLDPNTKYFLKAAFFKEGSTNYFGLTQVGNNWVKNGSTFDTQYDITTDGSGNWEGELNIRNDPSDSGYPGTGDYQLKIGRYSPSGSGPTWSNSLSVILEAKKTTPSTTSNTAAPTPEASPVIAQPLATPDPAVLGAQTSNLSTPKQESSDINYKLPDISGAADKGPIPAIDQKVLVAGKKTTNWWFVSSGTILFGIGGYHYWRSKKRRSTLA